MHKMETSPMIKIEKLSTEIRHLTKLTASLDGPQLYIKRDNKMGSGLSFGGSRVRRLETLMKDALNKGAEYIFTSGGLYADHIRLIPHVAAFFGLKTVVVITAPAIESEGYLWLKKTLRAKTYFVPVFNHMTIEEQGKIGHKGAKELQRFFDKKGRKTYLIPRTVEERPVRMCNIFEITRQVRQENLNIQYIVKSFMSASSFASFIVANKVFHTGMIPVGINVFHKSTTIAEETYEKAKEIIQQCNLDVTITKEEIHLFTLEECGIDSPKESGVQAIKVLAHQEAIFLDHNLTGRTLAGMFGLIQKGYVKKEEGVLFLHTGESPALSALNTL